MTSAARIFTHPGLPGLTTLEASFTQHSFPLHIHATHTLGVILDGVNRFWNRGAHHLATRQTICVVNPDEPHTGGTCTPAGFAYFNLYIPDALLLNSDAGRRAAPPRFPAPLIADGGTVNAVLALRAALRADAPALLTEQRWLELRTILLGRHARADVRPEVDRASPRQISMARELLDGILDEQISLATVAAHCGLSTFQLVRGFVKYVGLPPHAYHTQRRVERARALILSGQTPAQAAHATGFADQAHLTRCFRRYLAITPGRLRSAAGRKNVQA